MVLTEVDTIKYLRVNDAGYTIEVHHVFSEVLFKFGALHLSQKLIWTELKLLPGENKHGLSIYIYTTNNHCNIKWFISDDFGLRSVLSHSETISNHKCYLYRRTRRTRNTSKRQHRNAATHQHINTSTHQHINTSTHQHINTSIQHMNMNT